MDVWNNYKYLAIACLCGAYFLTCGSADKLRNDNEELKRLIPEFMKFCPVLKNDYRQRDNCKYINTLLKYFGNERCLVVGSSGEETRIRAGDDEGDFDYLMISEITVPVSALEPLKDMPCYVHVDGSNIVQKLFENVDLIEGRYLPSSLLKTVHPAVFTGLKGIFEIVKLGGAEISGNTPRVQIENEVKPGFSLVEFRDWDCDDFSLKSTERPISDIAATLRLYRESLESSSLVTIQDVMDTFGKAVDVLQWVLDVTDSKIPLAQTFGPLINAVGGTSNPIFASNDETDRHERPETIWTVDGNQPHEQSREKQSDTISARYKWKTNKEFIAAFPLSGRPKGLEIWKERQRKWPSPELVDDIFYNTEFFVVAKPGPLATKKDARKEFCLGFNLAEQKLAKVLSKPQKNCLLIIKAFKKSHLRKFSEKLTTYHWKTAFYWKLEEEDQNDFTEEHTLTFIIKVLDFMIQSLETRYLEHYFIKSNLFVGFNAEMCNEIIAKIYELRDNPVQSLKHFIEQSGRLKTEHVKIPREKMEEARKIYSDPTHEVRIKAVTAALEHFTRAIVKSKSFRRYQDAVSSVENPIHNAILDVMDLVLHDMEVERREEAEENDQPVRSLPINKTLRSLRKYLMSEPKNRKSTMNNFVMTLILFIK